MHNLEEDNNQARYKPFNSDKPFSWSPKGTYLIVIKAEKVEFLGGSNLKPLLTINEPKVEAIIFSPCETYVLVYQPKNDFPYAVWNFVSNEKIREFEQAQGEDANTFKWSYDGAYIAKIMKKAVQTEEGEEQEEGEEATEVFKTYVAVYELPSMKLTAD